MAASNFGSFLRETRLKKGDTLRRFCKKNNLDPGNVSKMERGFLPAPQDPEKLASYAKALGVRKGSPDWIIFHDLASASSRNFKPREVTDEAVLRKLPVLFRTLDNKDVTEGDLDRIIAYVRRQMKAVSG